MQDQDLPVGARTRADADARDAELVGNGRRELARHALEDDAERAGFLERDSVYRDLRSLLVGFALDLESAHLVDELRRQAEVTHDRDPDLGQTPGDLDNATSAFELDRVHAGLLHKSTGAGDRLLGRRVIRHEWHIADQQGLPRAPSDRLCVVKHVFERHGKRRPVPEHHHAKAVADKEYRDARLVEDARA